jgi:hypothetical protein
MKPPMLLKLSPMRHESIRATIQLRFNDQWHTIGRVSAKEPDIAKIMRALGTEYDLTVSGSLQHPSTYQG